MTCDWAKTGSRPCSDSVFPQTCHVNLFLRLSLARNFVPRDGVHGHDNHDDEDHHSTHHSYHDDHNSQDYHNQDAHDNGDGLPAEDHINGAGPRSNAGGGFGPWRRHQGAAFLQASHHHGGALQSPDDDGCLLAQDQAGHGFQNALSTWNNR